MEEDALETTQSFSANSDICQQLLNRYAHSSAVQHRHLCATAAATRSIIDSSTLSLTPISYFAATITSLSNSKNLDSAALAALTSFLSIVLPLVSKGEIKSEKAGEAVRVLVGVVEDYGSKLGTSSFRAVVKCVGILVAEFCDSKNWDSVSFGFEWLLKFSLDKRPKVRKCAQDCLLTVFTSFGSSTVFKKASKLFYSLLKDHVPLAMEMTSLEIVDRSKSEVVSRPEHQEVLHLFNVMKHVVPSLSLKYRMKTLSQFLKISSSQFSVVTRHIFEVVSMVVETSESEVIVSNVEGIFKLLVSYISLKEKNPADTVLFAATIAKTALGKIGGDNNEWAYYFPMLTESLAGLLSSEADMALQASNILRELFDCHIDRNSFLNIESLEIEDEATCDAEVKAVANTCNVLYDVLNMSQLSNEHLMSIVAFLFLKLGGTSHIFMKDILLKLADLMNATPADGLETKHLLNCIGSAVAAMGPEKLLELLPMSFSANGFSCSNTWLIPILKENVVGSSLRFFMGNILPLAESFDQASHKVKKSVIRQDLQACAHDFWGLLPAFCRQPSDTYESFPALAKLLLPFIKKDSYMLENIAIGLQALLNKKKSGLVGPGDLMEVQGTDDFALDVEPQKVKSRKITSKKLKALSLCSKDLLQALIKNFLESPPATRKPLKGAIECLVSVCDPSVAKQLFVASLKKFQLLNEIFEHKKVNPETNTLSDEEESDAASLGADAKRFLILDLASCFVEGSDDDMVNILFCIIKRALQATDEICQIEACQTLCRILEKHSWFCSSQFDTVMELLTGLKSSVNVALIKNRFSCFQALLIYAIMDNLEEENTKSFLILNEIILALKDSDEEGRKAAYDALNGISSKLRNSSDATFDGSYHKLLRMFIGYLSGSSPQIKSGVVSALSILIYNDPKICVTMPDMVPSVMELLHSKTVEVIKAVLGFVKVLVSCLESYDLHHFLSGIMDGILRWSSVSRHHFKTKVTVILEILIRKCGTATVKGLAPDKYKDFVHDVVANRHGKSNSKDSGSRDTVQEIPYSSPTWKNKRKPDEDAIPPKEEGSVRPWKRKMGMKREGLKHSNHGDFKHDLNKHQGGNPRGLKRDFSGGNKHKVEKNNKGNNRRPAAASKVSKHGKKKGR